MNIEQVQEIVSKDKIYINEPMSKHTSFKVGGPADIFVKVKTLEELIYVLKTAKQENVQINIIGNGSNVLVKDNGIRGIVVKLDFKNIDMTDDLTFSVGAGVSLILLAKEAAKKSLTGLEFASGIPGTVGGAIKMNAGAYGGEMKDIVSSTTYLDEDLNLKTISNSENEFGYRSSIFIKYDKYIIINSSIKLKKGNLEEINKVMLENSNSRMEKQPINYPSAGSTFKRGEGYITAKLIDEAGLKGYNIGDAYISEKHAGFIINKGNATAKDICSLIEYVKNTIHEKFGIKLDLEIKILGE